MQVSSFDVVIILSFVFVTTWRLLQVHKQQAEIQGKYSPSAKQERWISHQQHWEGRGFQHFFHYIFTSTIGPQDLGIKIQIETKADLLSVKEESVCELLQKPDPYK